FGTIVRAIAEGRQLFRNLKMSFAYLVMIHVPIVVSAAVLPAAGYPLLYLPAHIVWLELLIHPTALLVFQDLPAGGRLAPAGRGRRPRFFSAAEWAVLLGVGALLAALVVGAYLGAAGEAGDLAHGRSMAIAVVTTASAAITAALSRLRTRAAWLVIAGTLALSATLIQTRVLATALHVTPLHLGDWAAALAAGLLGGALAITLERAGTRGT
ncbi:MAG TPA: cation transporting ATPase C-terminal domain-containing protein, partial [Methylomirabilota bacterium]|nr:cation transporting ATPase C-terminal domain-containing protein [Methylomirabilota bacterium]